MEWTRRRADCVVTSCLLLLAVQVALVKTEYPKCQDEDEIRASWIEMSEDYPGQTAITDCKGACKGLSDSTTLAGVQGTESVSCFCGDTDVTQIDVSECSYDCAGETDSCGGAVAVSVYTVCDPGNYGPECSLSCPENCADNVCDIDSGQCNVKSKYPQCQDEDEIHASWLRTNDDYTYSTAITDCIKACREQYSKTLAGVQRFSSTHNVAGCNCGDADVTLVDLSECYYDCEGDTENCGGTYAVSVYTVCDPGLYHYDCSLSCPGHCADDVCDIDYGKCNGQCQDQWYGSYCDKSCSTHCAVETCYKETGVCDGGCDPGYYTPGCNEECSQNCAQTSCNIDDGRCDGGCEDGWYGSQCDMTCPINCDPNTCDVDDGTCGGNCTDGFYGSYCEMSCSQNCAHIICNKDSGTCDGSCKEGWYGSKCDSVCPTNCDGGCDRSSGDCTKCDGGKYGNKCDTPCPDNCNQTICDFSSGDCTQGCNAKFYGSKCDIQCPINCIKDVCDFQTGHCSHGCEDGFYGYKFCALICPGNCAGNVCDNVDGDCSLGCERGFTGSRCDAEMSTTPVWVWPVLAIAVLAVGALGFVGGVFFWSRRQKSPGRRELTGVGTSGRGSHINNSDEDNGSLPRKIYVNDLKETIGPILPETRNQLDNVDVSDGRPRHHGSVINHTGNNGDLSRGTYVNDKEDVKVDVRLSDGYEEYEGEEQPVSVYDELGQRTSCT